MHSRYRDLFFGPRMVSFLGVISMLAIAGVILTLRNLEPLTNDIAFAEDGAWLGIAMTKGWWHTLVNARIDYFVWGNLLFVYLATLTSDIFCGDKLACYPLALTFWSYFFYASVSVLCYYITKGFLPTAIRWMIFLATMMIPLGDTSGEVFGKICNIGFYFVFIATLLMFAKQRSPKTTPLTDIVLLICVSTNPVCLVLTTLFSFFTLIDRDIKKWIKKYGAVTAGCIIIGGFIFFRMIAIPSKGTTGSFRFESLIEVSLAKAFIYPFIFPFYTHMTDTIVVALSLIILAIMAFLLIKEKSKDVKTLVLMCAVAYFTYAFFTIYMRRNLSEVIGGYTSTFPDRYFMGLNLIVMFSFLVLAGSSLRGSKAVRTVGAICLASFAALYLTNIGWLFEGKEARTSLAGAETFQDQLCTASQLPADADGNVSVQLYPLGWYAAFPKSLVADSVEKIECTKEDVSFYVTDPNWESGIARRWPGFFVHNTPENVAAFKIGNTVQFADKTKRKITDTSITDDRLNVFVEGKVLKAKNTSFPFKFTVTDKE